MGVLSQDEYIKRAEKKYAAQKEQAISDNNSDYAKTEETIKSLYQGKIEETEMKYDDLSRQNEVQKYINAREVAENNANLGITDSGLNRTQQTAVQLSASNNEAKIQRTRQSGVDALVREMTVDLSENETNRANSVKAIKQYYEGLASSEGAAAYKADVEAETARIKAQQEFVSKYGLTDFLKNYGDEGYRITATGELTNEPISVNEFDMTLYNKNIKANNGNSYISAIASALEQKHKEEGRTFNAQEFLVEMTANSYITPNECSLLLYHYNHGTLSSMYGK